MNCLYLHVDSLCHLSFGLSESIGVVSTWRAHVIPGKFIWMMIRNVYLLCSACDFRAYFGHLGASIAGSFVHYSYFLTWIVSICLLMVDMSLEPGFVCTRLHCRILVILWQGGLPGGYTKTKIFLLPEKLDKIMKTWMIVFTMDWK